MIPEKILLVLKIIYDKLHNKDILWVLSGSTSLVIQGVDINIRDDIDILTDKEGTQKIDELLSDFRVKSPDYSSTDKYKSYFGIYKIGDVKVEIVGEFQYKMKDGSWSQPNQNNKTITKEFNGMTLFLLPLKQELKEYENMEREDKVEKIRKVLNN